jgi:hypothetical protein
MVGLMFAKISAVALAATIRLLLNGSKIRKK